MRDFLCKFLHYLYGSEFFSSFFSAGTFIRFAVVLCFVTLCVRILFLVVSRTIYIRDISRCLLRNMKMRSVALRFCHLYIFFGLYFRG